MMTSTEAAAQARACSWCASPVVGRRATAEFCSAACKKKAWRQRTRSGDGSEGQASRADLLEQPFRDFSEAVRRRLELGRQTYGDRSFSSDPTLAELEQEALDLAGWGFVLFTRLRAIRAAATRLDINRKENTT